MRTSALPAAAAAAAASAVGLGSLPADHDCRSLPGADLAGQDRKRGVTQHLMWQRVGVHVRIVARTARIVVLSWC
ncbi:MAG: hypothetical protein ACLQFR_04440 [Streptosporangiaceae bacterium]